MAHVYRLFDDMLNFGGMPEVCKTKEHHLKKEILINYFDAILYKDCLQHHTIRDVRGFTQLVLYTLSHSAQQFSYQKLANALNLSDITVKHYLQALQSCYLIEQVDQHPISMQQRFRSKPKIYAMDQGLAYATTLHHSPNTGSHFETLVYQELRKQNPRREIFTLNKPYACDFLYQENGWVAIQACAELTEDNQARETRSLLDLPKRMGQPVRPLVLTLHQEQSLAHGIDVIPFWKFFSS